ncbi:tetratricopeptide repeat protein 38-like isoform X2 [Pocillopora damicornis]|uniref:tetratricopeptide repeat protein 38-like isoform X2 n=1 Tax=Pocillopora damicornis TaxID=46731 RepID=UPI000F555E84|nr:tetratricopeptide repeat protein 38-like isoform X2 [Pocillopora damicornis]
MKKAWRSEGLSLTTTSNEAAKMFDATLTQYTGWYDDSSVDGIEGSVSKMLATDPNFVMGHVISCGLYLISSGKGIHTDEELKNSILSLEGLAAKSNITNRERLHVKAVKEWAEGNTAQACLTWEDVLVENPTDMLALKMAHDSYFYLGYQPQIRDSIARVMPKWKENMPLYGYLHGMYAFGLLETGFYKQAERHALKGLELNPRDCWSTHAEAHVIEMEGRQNEGIRFLSTTLNDWTMGAMLACHNYWHWALYHIEKGEHQAAVDIYDEEVGKRCHSGAMLDLVDASSLLYRLQMEGVNVNDRWRELFHLWESHTDDHILAFNDVHMLMCSLGAKKEDATLNLMMSLRDYVRDGSGTNCEVSRGVGLALCEAFEQADKGNFDKAVDILKPLRYDVVTIGGSNAQRDIFSLFLIYAALHSSRKEHHYLARSLLTERKAMKENAPMTDRLMGQALALHVE